MTTFKKLPNASLMIVEGAGHVPTITRPEEVARRIQGFFDTAGLVGS